MVNVLPLTLPGPDTTLNVTGLPDPPPLADKAIAPEGIALMAIAITIPHPSPAGVTAVVMEDEAVVSYPSMPPDVPFVPSVHGVPTPVVLPPTRYPRK